MIGVFVIIYNKESGEILAEREILARGSKNKLIGGTLEEGEKELACLEREVKEESGLVLPKYEFLCKKFIDGHVFHFYYAILEGLSLKKACKTVFLFQPRDKYTSKIEWLKIKDFIANSKYSSYIEALKEFEKYKDYLSNKS